MTCSFLGDAIPGLRMLAIQAMLFWAGLPQTVWAFGLLSFPNLTHQEPAIALTQHQHPFRRAEEVQGWQCFPVWSQRRPLWAAPRCGARGPGVLRGQNRRSRLHTEAARSKASPRTKHPAWEDRVCVHEIVCGNDLGCGDGHSGWEPMTDPKAVSPPTNSILRAS